MARKLKGKEWYTIFAPKFFDNKIIGKTPASEESLVLGRKVEAPLPFLTNDLSKYYLKFFFKITRVEDKNAFTEFWGMECMRDYISRMIRYKIRRMDTNQVLTTKDGVKLRVKCVVITRKKIKGCVEAVLRKFVEERIKNEVETKTLDEFLKGVIDDSFKNSIIKEGSKIYPIRAFEVRKIERLA